MKLDHKFAGLLVAASLCAAPLPGRAGDSDDHVKSFEGPLQSVVDHLRAEHKDVDIVLEPDLRQVTIEQTQLRSEELDQELDALRVASGNRFMWRSKGDSMYLLESLHGPEERRVEVFNLAGYLAKGGGTEKADKDIDSLLKIVGDTIKAFDDKIAEPKFQFYPDAKLLIVIGSPRAIEVARQVVDALPGQPPAAWFHRAVGPGQPGSFGFGYGFGGGSSANGGPAEATAPPAATPAMPAIPAAPVSVPAPPKANP